MRAVADELELSEPVAVTLVRRGYRTPELARAFLAADESHPGSAFDSMEEIVDQMRAAIAAGKRITVHGDFDVDGVCATDDPGLDPARARRRVRLADPRPDRRRLRAERRRTSSGWRQRGTALLLTVDCGITAVEEVRRRASWGWR